ncbi:MAG: hypothetical protein KDJ47_09655 [Hyphomicrobiaceae bacterium]|nr:hypothetical protein [Hyphomicrobiaceae bacterium]
MAAAIALAAMAAWSAAFVQKGKQIERARVERIGKKIDAKAQRARAKVAKKTPAQVRQDLRRYCIDC